MPWLCCFDHGYYSAPYGADPFKPNELLDVHVKLVGEQLTALPIAVYDASRAVVEHNAVKER